MEQEKFQMTGNDSVENQVTTSAKQELREQVNGLFDKIAKRARWGITLCLAVITLNLWLSLTNSFEPHVGYKLILFSALVLIVMIKSVVDLFKIEKLKKNASPKEQLEAVLRSKKYHLMSRWVLIAFMTLYISIDVLHDRSLGTLVGGILFILLFSFLYFMTYEKMPSYVVPQKLEESLRQLIDMEE